MLIFLSETYTQYFSFLNLFNYLTFRTGGAILTSLFFSLIFGESIINYLSSLQPVGQPIRLDGPARHIIDFIQYSCFSFNLGKAKQCFYLDYYVFLFCFWIYRLF